MSKMIFPAIRKQCRWQRALSTVTQISVHSLNLQAWFPSLVPIHLQTLSAPRFRMLHAAVVLCSSSDFRCPRNFPSPAALHNPRGCNVSDSEGDGRFRECAPVGIPPISYPGSRQSIRKQDWNRFSPNQWYEFTEPPDNFTVGDVRGASDWFDLRSTAREREMEEEGLMVSIASCRPGEPWSRTHPTQRGKQPIATGHRSDNIHPDIAHAP